MSEALAAEVRSEMGRKNKQIKDMASALNVSRQHASDLRQGLVAMDVDQLVALSEWLEIAPTDLWSRAIQATAVGAA